MRKKISYIAFLSILGLASIYFVSFDISPDSIQYKDGPHIFLENDSLVNILSIDQEKDSFPVSNPEIKANFLKMGKKDLMKYLFRETIVADTIKNEVQCVYEDVEKIFCIGDIHGEYDALVSLLKKHKIISEDLNWRFGNGHVVFCGDVFDRGDKVTETLLFIYKLEQQATCVKGKVHFLLGNHEMMALNGNLKYLNKKYKYIQDKLGVNYTYLYNENTLIGEWIRTKNTIVKINDLLFVHGGIHPDIPLRNYSLENINNYVRNYLTHKDFNQNALYLTGTNGPLWYRGYLDKDEKRLNMNDILCILKYYNAKKIIFAHTPVDRISSLYDGKLIAIDVPLTQKNGEGLLIQEGKFLILTLNGNKKQL
ncbi:MAG: metallophosphoesterase [Candidatus Symbiothrix sp.]|jgi:hypothetical protein|nr:metallophosphoesterase [Candidatus Symbiothrix sp.]